MHTIKNTCDYIMISLNTRVRASIGIELNCSSVYFHMRAQPTAQPQAQMRGGLHHEERGSPLTLAS